MKQRLLWLGVLGALVVGVLSTGEIQARGFALDQVGEPGFGDLVRSCMNTFKQDCQKWASQGGGSDAPRLQKGTHAELAIGEKYILSGTVENDSGEVYLRIDFRKHPWLANRTRVKNPYYRIDDLASRWKPFYDRDVTIVVTARYDTWVDRPSGRTILEIYLEPSDEPIIEALQ